MNGELLSALERIEREKGISKDILFEAIESAIVSAARKVIDDPSISKEDITVTMNKETGAITVYAEGEEVENERFGRIAAQTAKQVIIQKIREAERDVIFGKYISRVGSIISGAVHRFEKGNVIIELDDAEALLPKAGQIPGERFRQGEQIRAYILDVARSGSGPEIVLSRTDEGFVKRLFSLEVPEISQGIVEIRAIAREAGERTKIAVHSKDEKVDPVGSCVGMRGSRVRDIVKELHGERIDIIRWYDDIRDLLPSVVSPAEVSRMVIDREKMRITMTVPRDQLSLLIGKRGRNIRLASKLMGWDLQAEAERERVGTPVDKIDGITPRAAKILIDAGYGDIDKVIEAGVGTLTGIKGVGEKTAEKIFNLCEKAHAEAVEEMERIRKEFSTRQQADPDTAVLPAERPEENGKNALEENVTEQARGEDAPEEVTEGSGQEEKTREEGVSEEEADKEDVSEEVTADEDKVAPGKTEENGNQTDAPD
ncbi:MAG: transcription termination factor NusA [Candidatus Omnitrophota bacterium]